MCTGFLITVIKYRVSQMHLERDKSSLETGQKLKVAECQPCLYRWLHNWKDYREMTVITGKVAGKCHAYSNQSHSEFVLMSCTNCSG